MDARTDMMPGMRPGSACEALLRPIGALPGVSKREAALLPKLVGGPLVLDVLFHLPTQLVDRRASPLLAEAVPGTVVTVVVEVVRHRRPENTRQPWLVSVSDGSAELELALFKPQRLGQLPMGARVAISGRLDAYMGRLRMIHPDFVVPAGARAEIPALEPVWPLCAGLGPSSLRRAVAGALGLLPGISEWLSRELLEREGWPGFADAIRVLQAPADDDPVRRERAHARLAYDELLAGQVAMRLVRAQVRSQPGRPLAGDGALRTEALRRFGFRPTASQAGALAEIDADLEAPRRMLRLLQGDVGAGKTLVALLAMLRAAEAGVQAALMAPTELLATQHHRTFSALAPVPTVLLTGGMRRKARRQALAALASGAVKLAIGTHALFSEDVVFRDLGLAVIDEQHRFGVGQRLMLGAKGHAVDVLVMTATPIPRTLLLARWGEMEVSRIGGKPAGRKPIRTTVHGLDALDQVVAGVARAVASGAQVFWVCPLVSESEMSDLAAAEARWAALRARLGEAVGLAHGRQERETREAALAAFAAGRTLVLVATTVIEVGVDVPAASVMVVEHAERFGLAQLHQLRGRVGRGAAESFCLLLHDEATSAAARARLAMLRATEDGFLIADEDFRLRGAGEALGLRQSGHPGFRLALADGVERLLTMARRDAEHLLERDPELASPRGRAARELLALFGYADGARLLGAG